MVLTNLSLYREYKKVINLLSTEVKQDFEYFDVKSKIIKSNFLTAWGDIQIIRFSLSNNPDANFLDKKHVNELYSKVYSHIIFPTEKYLNYASF